MQYLPAYSMNSKILPKIGMIHSYMMKSYICTVVGKVSFFLHYTFSITSGYLSSLLSQCAFELQFLFSQHQNSFKFMHIIFPDCPKLNTEAIHGPERAEEQP